MRKLFKTAIDTFTIPTDNRGVDRIINLYVDHKMRLYCRYNISDGYNCTTDLRLCCSRCETHLRMLGDLYYCKHCNIGSTRFLRNVYVKDWPNEKSKLRMLIEIG